MAETTPDATFAANLSAASLSRAVGVSAPVWALDERSGRVKRSIDFLFAQGLNDGFCDKKLHTIVNTTNNAVSW